MEKPLDWPKSPLFLETSIEARKRQKAFYQRAYGHLDPAALTLRVSRHLEYLEFMSLPEQNRLAQAKAENYTQLLSGLDDL